MSEPDKRAPFLARYGFVLALAPVLYLLSIGPAAYFFKLAGQPKGMENFLEVFYYPIEWLWDNSQAARAILERYLEFFR